MDMDEELELKDHLSPHEALLWSGRPRRGIVFRSGDIFMIPFSLLWCGFALFWEIFAIIAVIKASQNAEETGSFPIIFPIFGIPFVVVGLYFVAGRFFVDAIRRKNTIYGITNERVVIKSGVFKSSLSSINLRTVSDLSMSEKADGSGTITFGPKPQFATLFGGAEMPGTGQYSVPSFEFIENVKEVYDILTNVQRNLQ